MNQNQRALSSKLFVAASLLASVTVMTGCDGSSDGGANTRRFGFAGPSVLQAGPNTADVQVADLNNDARPDLIFVDRQSDIVSIRLNETPARQFTLQFGPQFDLPTGSGPEAVAFGDLNNDRFLDLVVVDRISNQVSIFLNQTQPSSLVPTFSAPQTFALPSGPRDVVLADINTDGFPDIVTVSQTVSQMSVYINATSSGAQSVILNARSDFAAGLGTTALTIGDLNRDGRQDVATVGANSDFVSVFLNTTAQGSPTAAFPTREDFFTGNSPQGVLIDDLNTDGIPDLAVTVNARARMDVFINQTGRNDNSVNFPFVDTYTLGTGPTDLVRGDFDNNGRTDFAVLQPTGRFATVYLNDLVLFDSDPADVTDFIIGIDLSTGFDAEGFVAADLNSDGQDDLIFANSSDQNIFVYLND